MKKLIVWIMACLICACCLYTHRRVIKAWLNSEPIPKAPKWHCWIKFENRR